MEQKRTVERSKAYPAIALGECVDLICRIRQALGRGDLDRDAISNALGYSKANGIANVKISALVQFGFLDRKPGGKYAVSSNVDKIIKPLNDQEKQDELQVAFNRPTLYAALVKVIEKDGHVPEKLPVLLGRNYGIMSNAQEVAAKCFIESGKSCGFLNDDGTLKTDSRLKDIVDNEQIYPVPPQGSSVVSARVPTSVAAVASNVAQSTLSFGRSMVFPLSNGMANLQLPGVITQKDVDVIKKYVEILEMEVQ